MTNRLAVLLAQSWHAVVAFVHSRRWAVIALAVAFALQAAFATLADRVGPFALWPHTVLLLSPAIYWLVVGNNRNCVAVTTVMGLLLCVCNWLGSRAPLGYVFAYWVGLPISLALPWVVERVSSRSKSPGLITRFRGPRWGE